MKEKGHTWLAARILIMVIVLAMVAAATGYVMFGEVLWPAE